MTVTTNKDTITVQLTCPWKTVDVKDPTIPPTYIYCDATITVDLTFEASKEIISGDDKDHYEYKATVASTTVTCTKGHKSTVTGDLSVNVTPNYC